MHARKAMTVFEHSCLETILSRKRYMGRLLSVESCQKFQGRLVTMLLVHKQVIRGGNIHRCNDTWLADFGSAGSDLWSYSTISGEWRDHGMSHSSPPPVSYCSMAAMAPAGSTQPKVWLYGGMSLDPHSGTHMESALLYQLSVNSEGVPVWTNINLPKAPNSRFGANIEVVGPFVFQYSGSQARVAKSGSGSDGDLHVLCTFADELLLPKWIDLSNLNKEPMSRVHYASAVVGTSIWIHGGHSAAESSDQRRAFGKEHELYLLATSPDALPSNVACPRGFKRHPPPLGPCIDIGWFFHLE
jgi:hypothetical protein